MAGEKRIHAPVASPMILPLSGLPSDHLAPVSVTATSACTTVRSSSVFGSRIATPPVGEPT